ncbi:uncharacterized protein DUF4827 [Dysgonomonas alginatilytica]|uniref:Uncharacterized protein DUF4827 n=1 Tax=Dysgonomonas alginatilytica TaxID=1605892 RepID=A0A2V3PQ59_9BACT|nr:DUF4827 domain-containing protein [Dysgonomonas alginatilytica]PXV65523.1 uncharacterized protein DUF4827 [Dysgonomonas alginatilytica]
MKKVLGLVCFFIGLCVAFGACSNTETYADKLKNERKNIARFINEHNIVVLSQYPANGVFEENQFFRDPVTGVYINVIDSGNGNRASVAKRSLVTVRFSGAMTVPANELDTNTNNVSGLQPMTFNYGISGTYSSTNQYLPDYFFLSQGIIAPLRFVGENARVSLIVPFAQGSTYQLAAFQPMYYEMLHYTTIINN